MQQQELIPDESAEESRVADLKSRFEALDDSGLIQGACGIQNPALYFRDEILGNPDKDIAEENLARIEQAYKAAHSEPGKFLDPTFWDRLRESRDEILASTDWTQLADAPVDGIQRRLWREYRQYLRDLPTHFSDESIEKAEIKDFEEYVLWKHKKRPNEIKAL